MSAPVTLQRSALLGLVRSAQTELWLVTPQIKLSGLDVILPYLVGRPVRVLTILDAERFATGQSDLEALAALRAMSDCQVRSLSHLTACTYAARGGMALVSSAPLTLEGLDSEQAMGWLSRDFDFATLEEWWSVGRSLSEQGWTALADDVRRRQKALALGDEIRRIGACISLSVRGARRTRRLDPREYGVQGEWGRAVRPVEVALYQLDDVRRARDELEAILARNGSHWNGLYLVPRHFVEKEWPRLFAAREKALRERLRSPEGQAALKAQLSQARRELTAFFTELYDRLPEPPDTARQVWVETNITAVLADVVSESILENSELEYRVLQITPEDEKSARELRALLDDPKLRSLQLTLDI